MAKYYKFTASTIYCGTDNEYFVADENEELNRKDLDEMAEEYARENAESFEYLVTGWNDDEFEDEDEKQEALDNYYADCNCKYEEITEEEWKEEVGIS